MNKKDNSKKQKKLAKKIKNKILKSQNDDKIQKMKNNLNTENIISLKKLKLFLICIVVLLIALIIRIFFLQFVQGEYLSTLASKQQTSSEVIGSKRGNIYDTTGNPLAISETVDTISINPSKIKKDTDEETKKLKETVAKGLSDIFSLDYNEVLEKVNSNSTVETIAKKVEQDKVDELKSWMKEHKIYSGINIDEESKRYYPYDSVASHVIGACGSDNQGLSGIEAAWDSILSGTSGRIVTSTDASQYEIPNSEETFVAAENGYDLTLTIDVNIQKIVEKYLEQAVNDNSCARGGNCIVMDPNTGDILAMASYPDYDLNSPFTPNSYYSDGWDNLSTSEKNTRLQEMWKVRSTSETYEPGSVFKLVTASVALEEDITDTDISGDFYGNGYETINDTKINCWRYYNPHGSQTLRNALENSCNPAFMQLAKRIGASTLYKYYKAFGFFSKTNVGLSGESTGIFYDLSKVGPVELATMSFGQRFTITPLQMCNAICAIANNGTLLQPRLVKSMTNTDTGEVMNIETTEVRQVISAETSSKIKSMMKSVVTDGTGKNAQVEGYSVGGKSGTSEPTASNLSDGYVASFAAISPVENTQVVILLTLYAPKGDSHQGGQVAGPVVSKILSEILPSLGIEPDQN